MTDIGPLLVASPLKDLLLVLGELRHQQLDVSDLEVADGLDHVDIEDQKLELPGSQHAPRLVLSRLHELS